MLGVLPPYIFLFWAVFFGLPFTRGGILSGRFVWFRFTGSLVGSGSDSTFVARSNLFFFFRVNRSSLFNVQVRRLFYRLVSFGEKDVRAILWAFWW